MRIFRALPIVLMLACAHVQPAVKCVADLGIVSEVIADASAADWEARLAALAGRVTLCVLDATIGNLLSPPPAGAKAATLGPTEQARLRQWLAEHPG